MARCRAIARPSGVDDLVIARTESILMYRTVLAGQISALGRLRFSTLVSFHELWRPTRAENGVNWSGIKAIRSGWP